MWRAIRILGLAFLANCVHLPTEQERQGAQIHYDLGVQIQQTEPQQAFREFELALRMDPQMVEARNAMGILLHLSFRRFEEAEAHYLKALELRSDFSEAKTNLANLYLDTQRYTEAIALYEQALNDMLYATPYIARGNLGWAYFKLGQQARALEELKAAVTINPKFCQGYRNLGIVYSVQQQPKEACKSYSKYREACPELSEALYQDGMCLARDGQVAVAKERFELCYSKSSDALSEKCKMAREQLGP